MGFSRREFMQVLAVASATGMALDHRDVLAAAPGAGERLYDVPKFGNVSFLHFTDCHAQLTPIHFREPSVNLGVADAVGRPPHLVGEKLIKHFKLKPGSAQAHAFTYLDFTQAAKTYGKVGGFAHLATLVKQLKASRPHALLLDGGDTWQGSATSLWTNGQDMVDACKLLGVNMMTSHWEHTFGAKRVQEIVEKDLKGNMEFLAQNIKTTDFEDMVFKPYALREMNGVQVAVIGQAFPYTPIANPRYMVPDWTFGIQDEHMQMAGRVRGVDAILGGHTHDGMPAPTIVKNGGGETLVTNAGSNSKFLGVLDFDVRGGKVQGYRYKLLPIFSNLLAADAPMQAFIDGVRAPYKARLEEPLAVTEDLLYRRGNFNGSWDQVICDALMQNKGADIAFSPGVRWGTSLLPGDTITFERMMDQMALTYPATTLNNFTGEQIKGILEDVADNIFNPDPYYQQGGDMVRVGGLQYTVSPTAPMGQRIQNMTLKDKPVEASKTYKVAGWASVQEGVQGEPIWDVVAGYLRNQKVIKNTRVNVPRITGMDGNPGIAF
jgi:sulfur-oxidizing protein SoxB